LFLYKLTMDFITFLRQRKVIFYVSKSRETSQIYKQKQMNE